MKSRKQIIKAISSPMLLLTGILFIISSCSKDETFVVNDVGLEIRENVEESFVMPQIREGILVFSDEEELDQYVDACLRMNSTDLDRIQSENGFVSRQYLFNETNHWLSSENSDHTGITFTPDDMIENLVANKFGEWSVNGQLYRSVTKTCVSRTDLSNLREFVNMRGEGSVISENVELVCADGESKAEVRTDCQLFSNIAIQENDSGLNLVGFAMVVNSEGQSISCPGRLFVKIKEAGISEGFEYDTESFVTFNDYSLISIGALNLSISQAFEDATIELTFIPSEECECDSVLTTSIQVDYDPSTCIEGAEKRFVDTYQWSLPNGKVRKAIIRVGFNSNHSFGYRSRIWTEVYGYIFDNIADANSNQNASNVDLEHVRFHYNNFIYKHDCIEILEDLNGVQVDKYWNNHIKHSFKWREDFKADLNLLPTVRAVVLSNGGSVVPLDQIETHLNVWE